MSQGERVRSTFSPVWFLINRSASALSIFGPTYSIVAHGRPFDILCETILLPLVLNFPGFFTQRHLSGLYARMNDGCAG